MRWACGTLSGLACIVASVALTAGAHARPGDLDPTFSKDGLVRTELVAKRGYARATSVVTRPDGGVVVAGQVVRRGQASVVVVAYGPDGRLDRGFGSKGVKELGAAQVGLDPSLVIADDGDLIVHSPGGGSAEVLYRLTPDGELDPAFNGSGTLGFDRHQVLSIALAPGGGVVLAGSVGTAELPVSGELQTAITRLTADGAVDSSFAGDGTLVEQVAGVPNSRALALATTPAGDVVIGGELDYLGNTGLFVARYLSSGLPDPSFSGDGLYAYASGRFRAGVIDVALDPQGRLSALAFEARPCVGCIHKWPLRLNADGAVDQGFGEGGFGAFGTLRNATFAETTAVDPAGGVLAVGAAVPQAQRSDFLLQRIGRDGAPDPTFSSDGIVKTNLRGNDRAEGVSVDSSERIVVAGATDGRIALARYETKPGPPDADADGVNDKRDDCPSRFGKGRDGCPA